VSLSNLSNLSGDPLPSGDGVSLSNVANLSGGESNWFSGVELSFLSAGFS
jgi:hypothetical protein